MKCLSRLAAVVFLVGLSVSGCAGEQLAEPSIAATTSPATETVTETATATPSAAASPASAAAKAKPDCSDKAVQDSGFGSGAKARFCQDDIAQITGVDGAQLAQWDGTKWVAIERDGGTCYSQAKLDSLNVPNSLRIAVCGGKREQSFDEAIAELPKGDPNSPYITVVGMGEAGEQASYPQCDGRSILILDSIIDNTSDTQFRIAQQVLTQDPTGVDRKFTVPGQCPSLRAQVDGSDIYPVYLDFGTDTNAMCAAKAKYGGNGRILSNSAEYVDPC